MIAIMGRRIIVWGSKHNLLSLCEKFVYRKGCRGKKISESLQIVSSVHTVTSLAALIDVISKIMPSVV